MARDRRRPAEARRHLPYFIGRLVLTLADPRKRTAFRLPTRSEALTRFSELIESGKPSPVVARTFPLDGVAQAMSYMQDPKALGRAVIVP